MFDKLINRIGVSLALVLMICELTYVNAKSLFYLTADTSDLDRTMSVIGSLAFSVVTVVVMRKAGNGWFKFVFPLFDAALVFMGFNLLHAQAIMAGTDNPVRFWLTVFLSLFTGTITYSLGLINYRDHACELLPASTHFEVTESESGERINELMNDIESLRSDLKYRDTLFESLDSELMKLRSDNAALQTELEDKASDCKVAKSQLDATYKELNKYRTAYLKAEASRIRKKNEANRTPEEQEILRMMEAN